MTLATRKVAGGGSFSTTDPPPPPAIKHIFSSLFLPLDRGYVTTGARTTTRLLWNVATISSQCEHVNIQSFFLLLHSWDMGGKKGMSDCYWTCRNPYQSISVCVCMCVCKRVWRRGRLWVHHMVGSFNACTGSSLTRRCMFTFKTSCFFSLYHKTDSELLKKKVPSSSIPQLLPCASPGGNHSTRHSHLTGTWVCDSSFSLKSSLQQLTSLKAARKWAYKGLLLRVTACVSTHQANGLL